MTGRIDQIWRHPIKSHGAEALEAVALAAGKTLPWDRVWAVTHEAAMVLPGAWSSCNNFLRVAKAPKLAAIRATVDEATQRVSLTHPERPELSFAPDSDTAAFLDWVGPLLPEGRAAPTGLHRADRGLTDNPEPTISLKSVTAHRMVEQKIGRPLSRLRWRGNLWVEGLEPGEEFDWVGKTVRVGGASLRVLEPITRCTATMANPDTGARDADTLAALEALWGEPVFGLDTVVVTGGEVAVGAPVELIP